jgi:hypothetical protein
MSWQVNKPDGSDSLQSSDDYLRDNFDWLEDTMARGHSFPGTSGVGATRGQHTPGNQPVCDLEIEAVLTGYTDVAEAISYPTDIECLYINDGSNWYARSWAPSGSTMLFCQATAPSGWTLVTSVNDEMLYVASGAASGTQQVAGGTWAISGIDDWIHEHEYSDVPYHRHSFPCGTYATPQAAFFLASAYYTATNLWSTDGDATPCSAASASVALGGDSSWRPRYVYCILATKDA